MICTLNVKDMVLDDENPWDGILVSTMLTLRATVRTMTQYTPAQFRQDSILNTHHEANWEIIKKCKKDLIHEGNLQDN